MKLGHHGDEEDHEGLRSGGKIETCEMFFEKVIHASRVVMGTSSRVLWSYREIYCVFTLTATGRPGHKG